MSDKTFRRTLSVLSVFTVLILMLGILLCIFPAGKDEFEKNPIEANAHGTESEKEMSIVNTSSPESFDSLLETVILLKNRYPELIKLYTAGYSEAGREILMYSLGSGNKKALITGAVHAREHITTKYLLKVTEDYCNAARSNDGYYGSYDIQSLLREYTLFIIPCANPDGLEIILSNATPEDNVKISKLSEYKANKNGVDINRNFPLAWDYVNNGVNSPADCFFKGNSAACAKETQTLIKLCTENQFEFMISVHIKGNCIFWGDTYKTDNNPLYKAFAQDICNASALSMTEPTKKPRDYGGGFENWFRHTFNRPGVCVELSDVQNTVEPCTRENYLDFDSFVNYEKSSYILAAAMASANK